MAGCDRKGARRVVNRSYINRVEDLHQSIPFDMLQVMFEKTSVAVMGVNLDGRIVLWNSAATKLFGYDGRQVLNHSCYELTEGHDFRGNLLCFPNCSVIRMLHNDKAPNDYILRSHTKNGDELVLNVSALLMESDGEALCLHLFHDVRWITEVVRPPFVPDLKETAPVALTARERQVLGLMVDGYDSHEMANLLYISYATVRNHVQNILDKLGVHSRVEAVVLAIQEHLVERAPYPAVPDRTHAPVCPK